MKRRYWIAIALVVAMIINLVFSILLIYNKAFSTFYKQYVNLPQKKVGVETEVVDQAYYEPRQLQLFQLVSPYQIILKQDNKFLHSYQSQVIKELTAFSQNPFFVLENNQPQIDPVRLGDIYDQDHVQLIFMNKLSLPLLKRFVAIPKDLETQFQVNRIVIMRGQENKVYFVDSVNKSYLVGKMQKGLDREAFFEAVDRGSQDRIEMTEYEVNRDTVYLPVDSLASLDQTYSLDKLPETYFIQPVFSGENFDITEPDLNNVRSYTTYHSSLMVDDDTNIMTVTQHNKQLNNLKKPSNDLYTQSDIIEKSIEMTGKFNYWTEDIRIYSQKNNQVTFRRFLAGLPIFSSPTMPDYGSSQLSFSQANSQLSLEKLQMPLLVLGINISDLSSPHLIESGKEIEHILKEQDLKFSKFNQIILGFEWQREMENFKKVKLVPKWFFVVGNQVYSIDQLKDGSLKVLLQQRAN